MKLKTTIKMFGQTMETEREISNLTYKQLQDYIREAKAQGFTGIKLNASKEALQAEVEAIEASKTKAADASSSATQLVTEESEVSDVAIPTVTELANRTYTYKELQAIITKLKAQGYTDIKVSATKHELYDVVYNYAREQAELVTDVASEVETDGKPRTDWVDLENADTPWCVICEAEDCRHLTSDWLDGVEGVPTGDHHPGQAVYPDWDESYTYESYLNSYCDLTCSLDSKPVDPLDLEYLEPSDHPCPCGQMTIHDCAGECGVMQSVETIKLAQAEFMQVCEEHGFTITPAIKEAFKDTRVNPTENLEDFSYADVLVANITYHGGDDAGKTLFHYYDKRDPVELLRSGIHLNRFTSTFSEVHGAACSIDTSK